MIYLVLALAFTSAALFAVGITQLVSGQGQVVRRRLDEIRVRKPGHERLQERRRRHEQRERITTFLEALGDRVASRRPDRTPTFRKLLTTAGYRSGRAVSVYLGVRVLLASLLAIGALASGGMLKLPGGQILMLLACGILIGWLGPLLVVKRRARKRQREIQRHLPDALDLLVVCVEAGLGLNQALARVADELDRVSPITSEELALVGLEMRAGTPREDALRHLGERTDVSDIRALVSMLIQTDRFGTSIADALRIHSETLRSIRQQRAEEAAAKTTIKMLFPLVFFIFPAIFVVVLGPAAIHLFHMFRGLQ